MKMARLALINFKGSVKSYMSLVISLAFTILVLYNFENIIYSSTFASLGTRNKDMVDMLVSAVIFVLGCFMFFFIWYSTNVFLTKRKREMGIYIFMGLTNAKIGALYVIETTMIGIASLILGLVFGVIAKELFQMLLLALSEIEVDVSFEYNITPVLNTVVVYSIIYLIFMVKGYFNILKSSILELISASRQNEYVRQKNITLVIKALMGIFMLGAGYWLAIKKSNGIDGQLNEIGATVLVTAGTYMLFGGFIPLAFQAVAKNKHFLYHRQRCLWINSIIFRLKKNYRTYAMVCVLAICSATALAAGSAMKNRYEKMNWFRNTYTFQILSSQSDLADGLQETIEGVNSIELSNSTTLLAYDNGYLISYSRVKTLADTTGLEFTLPELADDETAELKHEILLSTITNGQYGNVTINGKEYHKADEIRTPYLGYIQEQIPLYVVNDAEYERLVSQSAETETETETYVYNYRVGNPEAFTETRNALLNFTAGIRELDIGNIAMASIDPNDTEREWIKVIYALCVFLFLVFIFAGGSVMFMKLSNDAYEEKGRYIVMRKLGLDEHGLLQSIRRELATAYILPFIAMTVSTYFSVYSLGKMMHEKLYTVYATSVFIVFVIFTVCYIISVRAYWRNTNA